MKLDPHHSTGISPFFLPKENPVANQENIKLTDNELWECFKQGDEAAFISIYKAYANPLFHFGCQFCSDREAVKDCLQDFFIYLRKNRAGFGTTDSIRFYLLKSFKRKIVDTIKKQSKTTEKKLRFTTEQFPVELSTEAKFIQQQMEVDLLADLNKALESLDNKEREAIYYFFYQGLSYEQVAGIFEFSHISSARRLIYKALANLKKIMLIPVIGYFIVNQPD